MYLISTAKIFFVRGIVSSYKRKKVCGKKAHQCSAYYVSIALPNKNGAFLQWVPFTYFKMEVQMLITRNLLCLCYCLSFCCFSPFLPVRSLRNIKAWFTVRVQWNILLWNAVFCCLHPYVWKQKCIQNDNRNIVLHCIVITHSLYAYCINSSRKINFCSSMAKLDWFKCLN